MITTKYFTVSSCFSFYWNVLINLLLFDNNQLISSFNYFKKEHGLFMKDFFF